MSKKYSKTVAEFQETKLGKLMQPILQNPRILEECQQLSRTGTPALQAVGREVVRHGLNGLLDHQALRIIGRWLKQELLSLGMVHIGTGGRVAPNHCWKTGATYGWRTT
ncbi:hypothetical protein N2605_00180 [Bradyrhizobium yuanmingense]|uniref:hypothetical protein n=1 Tax=Bradyrhizobium yuanmingense TaxID=108015 RepID=UPI0021A3EE18|nr:hypothetical protein [Bradyrhizobium sp. CB1024]UWU84917.1 hypothetical protein N2605_00180 [Bradyrhizobium sp. CB1024]